MYVFTVQNIYIYIYVLFNKIFIMISARQNKNMLEKMVGGGSSFTAPSASFTIVPNSYTISSVPVGITMSGTITPNDGIIVGWSILNNSTTIASGTGTSISHALSSIPSTVGTYNYSLNVTYTDDNNATLSIVVPAEIIVGDVSMFGQLANPTDDISLAADLTPAIEATFTDSDQATMINLFNVVAPNTGRIVFVIPDQFGTLLQIEDGAGLNVLNQFNVVIDAANSRKIYTSINALVPATYSYKLVF